MKLKRLRYFIAVAEAGNIGRAAERLHVSQPPLTRQIQALEAEIGEHLFLRTARGVELTAAGQQLLTDARNISLLVEQAAERATRAGRGELGRIDVGLYGSASFEIVPQVLSVFGKAYPDVEIVLHYAQAHQQVEALRQGRVDVVFERLLPDEPDIASRLIAREPVVLVLNASHPLARLRAVHIRQLRHQPMVVQRTNSSPLSTLTMRLCLAHGFEPRAVQEASDVVTATIAVAISGSVCIVPQSMRNVRMPGVVYRPLLSDIEAMMPVHCFYLKQEPTPVLAMLLDNLTPLDL